MTQEFITTTTRDTVLLHINDVADADISSLAKTKAYEWVKSKAWDMDIAEWMDEGHEFNVIAQCICEIIHDGIVDGTYNAEDLAQ